MVFKCLRCSTFQSLELRDLLSHYHQVHSNEINLSVKCDVYGCPAAFQKYNSLYKHIRRHHDNVYLNNNEIVHNNLVEPLNAPNYVNET